MERDLHADSPDRKRCLSVIALSAVAQDKLPLFDCHIHYSFDATEAYPPASAVKLLDQAGIGRAVVSSTPNDGTIKLHALDPERFIPFLRPYRKARDASSWAAERQSWYRDPETLTFIERSSRVASIAGSANST